MRSLCLVYGVYIHRWKLNSLALLRIMQVWHGNLSCVKALVEGGARLGQRNRLGYTPREGAANAGPLLNRGGRLPKALRHTLEYLERAEVSRRTKYPPLLMLILQVSFGIVVPNTLNHEMVRHHHKGQS